MKVLTEADLRREKLPEGQKEYHISPDVFVTPSAKEYLWDRNVALVAERDGSLSGGTAGRAPGAENIFMTRVPVEKDTGVYYMDAVTGEEYRVKPEDMTHIRGSLLVKKTHPRIYLRGQLDGLQARVILLQARFPEYGRLCEDLDSVREYISAILGAEVKDMPLCDLQLFGMESEEIREMSHNVRK